MRKLLFVFASVCALAGMGYLGTWVAAQDGVKPAVGGGEAKPTLKIGVVNITKVIKEFKKANTLGDKILKDATEYEGTLKKEQEELKAMEMRLATLPSEAEKDALHAQFQVLSEDDAFYGVEFLVDAATRKLTQKFVFEEFLAETYMIYTACGGGLRAMIAGLQPRARAAWEQVYALFRASFGGVDYT